jgi:hypothetical protein
LKIAANESQCKVWYRNKRNHDGAQVRLETSASIFDTIMFGLSIGSAASLVLIALMTSSARAEPQAHPSFDCMAAYAKSKGISDPVFDPVEYDSEKPECVEMRHKFISNVRKEIRSKINEAETLPKYSSCIYDKLTGSDSFVNSIIKAAALEYSGSVKESGKLNSTVDTMLDYIKSSVVACKSENDFGDEFDSIFEAQKMAVKNITDHQEEHCIKKYLIKNNLIDFNRYNIELNPHNINTTGLNCEDMIKKSNEDIYEQLGFVYLETSNLGNFAKVECALEKFREADYFDLMMKITTLTVTDITPEQRFNERENFIRVLTSISSNIAKC